MKKIFLLLAPLTAWSAQPSLTGEKFISPMHPRVTQVLVTPVLTDTFNPPSEDFKQDLNLKIDVTVENEVAYRSTGTVDERIPQLAVEDTTFRAFKKVGVTTAYKLAWKSNPIFDLFYGVKTDDWEWETLKNQVHHYDVSIVNGQHIIEEFGTQGPVADRWYHVTLDIDGYKKLVVFDFKMTSGKLVQDLHEKPRP